MPGVSSGNVLLAQPIEALPSGLQRFTSVFGMGTGGATGYDQQKTAPELEADFWGRFFVAAIQIFSKNTDSLKSTYRKFSNSLGFVLLNCHSPLFAAVRRLPDSGLIEK